MKELSRESRALLVEARRIERLSASDKARIRSRLTQRIGAGLAIGTALTATATVAEAAHTGALASIAAWLPAAAKVVSLIAITGAVSVGVVKANRMNHRTPERAAVAVKVAPAPGAQPIITHNAGVAMQASATPDEASTSNIDIAAPTAHAQRLVRGKHTAPPTVTPTERAPAASSGVAEPAPTEPVTTDGLAHQVAAIRTARAAIRDGDPQAALAALDSEMPAGQAAALAPEATLARVAAYCRLGQTDAARRTADQFLLQYPNSPLAARIRNSCAGEGASMGQP